MIGFNEKVFLILCAAMLFACAQSSPRVVDSMVNINSSHLLNLVGDGNISNVNEIKQYLSNPLVANDSLRRTALLTLLDYATYLSSKHSKESYIIQDEVVFKLCISVLANCDETFPAERAFDELCKYGRFDYLTNYSDAIQAALAGKKKIGHKQAEELLCLLNLSVQDKKKLLDTKYLPEYVRARLGDTTAENKLMSEYLSANTKKLFYVRKRLVDEMGTVATPRTIRFLVRVFNDTIYGSDCGKASIAACIIPKLGRLNPDNQLLTDQYEKVIHYPQRSSPQESTAYLKKVIDWMKKTYSVAPEIAEPLPFVAITGICEH